MAEAVIAVGLVGLLMMVLSAGLMSGFTASQETKRIQQATALGTAEVEKMKDINYASLAMSDGDLDLGPDPNLLASCPGRTDGNRFFDPDGEGPLTCERIRSVASGATVTPHVTTENVGSLTFAVKRYVTWVGAGNTQDYLRVTAIIEYDVGSKGRSERVSGTVINVQRGIPAPEFELIPTAQGKKVLEGHDVVFAHRVRNLGFEDAYQLQMIPEPPSLRFHRDLNANGELDDGEPELVGGATPLVAFEDTFSFLAVWEATAAATPQPIQLRVGSTKDTQFTKTAIDTIEVTDEPIGATLYLHACPSEDEDGSCTPAPQTSDDPPSQPVGPQSARTNLPMDPNPPTATTLQSYSDDVDDDQPGRRICPPEESGDCSNSGANETDPWRMSNWVYQLPSRTILDGNATLRLLVPTTGGTCPSGTITAHLLSKQNATDAAGSAVAESTNFVGTATPNGANCIIVMTIPMDTTIDTGRWLELKLTTSEGIVIGYDTVDYDSSLTLPLASAATS